MKRVLQVAALAVLVTVSASVPVSPVEAGEQVVFKLTESPENAGIFLPHMRKSDLFKTVILDGALPRKTFSMGEAHEKRFYVESRRIA